MAEKMVNEEASGTTRWIITYWEASSSILSVTVGEGVRVVELTRAS